MFFTFSSAFSLGQQVRSTDPCLANTEPISPETSQETRAEWERDPLNAGSIFLTFLPVGMFELRLISFEILKTTLQMWNLSRILDVLWPCKILRRFGFQMSAPQECPHCSAHSHGWSKWWFAGGVSYPVSRHKGYVQWPLAAHDYHTTMWFPSWALHDPGCPLYRISARLPSRTAPTPLLTPTRLLPLTLDLRL